MQSIELFWAYLITIFFVTVTPGVDTLLVVRNTARGGWKDGLASNFGVCSGLFVHATLSSIGISIILLQTAWAFSMLKWAGALYLIWLGVQSLRQAIKPKPMPEQVSELTAPVRDKGFRLKRSLREGVLSNVLNVKVALFYMAFLPQFIDPAGPGFPQAIALAAIHFAVAILWQSGLVFAFVHARQRFDRPRIKRVLHGLTGGLFVGLGGRLAATATP